MKSLLLIALLTAAAPDAWAKKADRGLMPELKLDQSNEDANQKKAVQSEVLITKSELKAIHALNAVLKKKKGTRQEPDLWYRMAELYMRRAKSGRFFDMNRSDESSPAKFAPANVREESAVKNLKQSIQIYNKIERDFPKFNEMDSVLFNNAFSNHQIGQRKAAETLYARMVEKYPRSPLVADAHLALGEIAYDAGQFTVALDHFKSIEKFKNSRVYAYGMYKQAWSHYNLKQNDDGIKKLIQVVKYFAPENKDKVKTSHNLRSEAFRDLVLFFGEAHPPQEAYAFFSKIGTPEEVGESMINMGKLYDSHGRQKEMNVFLGDYIKRHPMASNRIKAEMLLIGGNETIKDRPAVIAHLEAANDVCRPQSEWRTTHAAISEAECDYDLAKATLETARKWWEIYLKNRKHKGIAELTEKAFKIHLDREDPKKPDAKSHYAYAELLFQQDKFREASEQYEFAAKNSADTQIAHDAAYSTIVALEKATAKKADGNDPVRLGGLCEFYLNKYPKGAQVAQVQYKLGFIAYEAKNYADAEKWFKPLASNAKQDPVLRTRSQDLMLDILNARQDLNGIRDFAKTILAQSQDPTRKKNLQKIMQEADYNSIQKSIEGSKDDEVTQNIEKLLAFHRDNKESTELAKNSFWQAMSLAFAKGRSLKGAGLALEWAKLYPQDDKTTEALRNAAKHYNEQGFLLKAAATLELLSTRVKPNEQAKIFEAVSEIYVLENRKADAREFLAKLLETSDKKEQGKLYSQLLASYKGEENSAEAVKLENKILSLNIDPAASELRLNKVEALFTSKKYTEAFNQAKSLVNNPSRVVGARARLLQAKVLGLEMTQQSTKTTLDRLPLVLSIKTEKLDKAQTAFMTASKMSEDPNVRLATLEGLAHLYRNYAETVGNPVIKTPMKDDERKALETELAGLVTPIKEKQIDIENKLKSLSQSDKTATVRVVDFESLPVTQTVKPLIPEINYKNVGFYLPKLTQAAGLFAEREVIQAREIASAKACSVEPKDLEKDLSGLMALANKCVSMKKYSAIEKIALRLAEVSPETGVAPYYLSIAAAGLGQNDKSLYLVDLALKKSANKSFFLYQKAIALGLSGERAQGNQLMIKAFDERLDAWETKLMHGVVAFSQGDCFSVTDDFKSLPSGMMDKFELLPALSECMAQKGEVDQALALVQKTLGQQKSLPLALQWGHLAEIYKMDSKMAASAYEKAKGMTSDPSTLEWLKTKIKWLNNPQSVSESDLQPIDRKVATKDLTGDGQ